MGGNGNCLRKKEGPKSIHRMRPSRRSISRTPQGRDSDMSATSSYSAYPASKAGRKRSSSSSSSSSEASYKFSRKKAGVQPPSGQDKQRDPQKATWDELGIDDISADEGSARSVSVTDDDLQFAKDMVKTHNKYRKLHGVPELKLSKKLTKLSKEWATKLAKDGTMKHRTGSKFGENLFMKWSSSPNMLVTATDACDHWYQEIVHYKGWDSESSSFGSQSGHFTQMIWRNSRYIGAAISRTDDGKVFIVGNYYPPGNFLGQYMANVPRPQGKKSLGFKPQSS